MISYEKLRSHCSLSRYQRKDLCQVAPEVAQLLAFYGTKSFLGTTVMSATGMFYNSLAFEDNYCDRFNIMVVITLFSFIFEVSKL